ncbi:hypothetical protein F511_14094 [Dorcoceras hygrometricum]|uniref:Dystroglycan-like n=1 Tax=Dorcoceras hygrometricum TaxID=472368 RepID=A0A2Z7CGU9_9LAMI|nr:hypothetical protein F511_14094 [Dorcoceras hygrometricum]
MDNPGMVLMFEALMASGLKGFLGCPAVLYEAALVEFFENASIRDGVVISTVGGKQVEISEELFASSFELPVDGLTDLSDVSKDIVFDARRIFSLSGEQVRSSDKKREMKIEFRLLSDIMAKTISVKAGSFDAVTRERFLMMAAINGGVKINWSRFLFNIFKDMVTPGSKQAKGYTIQICLLLKNVPLLALGDSKEFPASKILTDKTVHRYIAVNDNIEVEDLSREKKKPVKRVVSRKRLAAVDKPVVKKKRTCVGKVSAVTASPALEAVPIQTVAPISTTRPSAPKRKIQKRKRRLALGSDDEIVEEPTAVVVVAIENPVPADADVVDKGISTADDVDNIISRNPSHFGVGSVHSCAPSPLEACQEPLIVRAISGTGDHSPHSLSPGPHMPTSFRLKREKIIDEVEQFFNSYSFRRMAALNPTEFYTKEEMVLSCAARRGNFVSGPPSTATDIKVLQMLSKTYLSVLAGLIYQVKLHGLQWDGESCSVLFEGEMRDRGAVIARSNTNFRSTCWVRTMIMVDGSWVIESCADYWKKLPRTVVCTEILPQISYVDTLPPISEFFKVMKKRWADVCIEAAQFYVSGKLLPGGSLNFCRTIAVVEPVSVFGSQRPTVTFWGWSQLCTASVRYSLFSGLSTVRPRAHNRVKTHNTSGSY